MHKSCHAITFISEKTITIFSAIYFLLIPLLTACNTVIGPAGGLVFYDKGGYTSDGNGIGRYLEAA
jgi:hypothetical protein